jgi:putative transposase
MPFRETDRVEQREALVHAWKSGMYRVSELARRFGVSRPTVYLWIARQASDESLSDRSRTPHQIPHRSDGEMMGEVLRLRKQHPHWGPKKLVAVLRSRDPDTSWPAPSTVGDLLKSEGLVTPKRRRNREILEREPLIKPAYAGQVMTADFKGHFRLGNGRYCYPLTIADPYSRFIYAIEALDSPSTVEARPVFERIFRKHGVPEMIVTDNGEPFCAPQGFARLSRLSVRWLRLGIDVRQTRPGRHSDNGRHERMHRTLKTETTRPPETTRPHQQRRFNAFRFTFNHERPHESLGQRPPASVHVDPVRKLPRRTPELVYAGHFDVRRVRHGGEIRWLGDRFFLSQCLAGERVGLEEVDDGVWSVYFGAKLLGRFHEGDRVLR